MMVVNVESDIIRVVILAVDDIYTQIYDEIYCTREQCKELLLEFGGSDKYKVILI